MLATAGLLRQEIDPCNVITVPTIALADEVISIQIRGRRMAAAVLLIQALGGGWTEADLPSSEAVTKR